VLGRNFKTINLDAQEENLISSFGSWRFYKVDFYSPFGDGASPFAAPVGSKNTTHYIAKNESTLTQHTFKEGFLGNSRFRNEFQEVFAEFPLTLNLVVEENFKQESFKSIVDLLELEYLFTNDEKANVDMEFEISPYATNYILEVDSIIDGNYYLSYYRPDSSLAMKKKLSFRKNLLNEFVIQKEQYHFDLTASLHSSHYFRDGHLDSMKSYYSNGQLFEHVVNRKGNRYYQMVYDDDGNPILDGEGNGQSRYFDRINQREVSRIYEDNKLLSAYFIDSAKKKIYLTAEDPVSYKFFAKFSLKINKELEEFVIEDFDYENLRSGFLLMDVLIDTEGNAKRVSIKRGVVPGIDELLLETVRNHLSENTEFNPAVHQNEKVSQTVIIPFYVKVYFPKQIDY